MKNQIGSPLLNKQDNGILGLPRKPKVKKNASFLGTLTLNRGILSQGSRAAEHAS